MQLFFFHGLKRAVSKLEEERLLHLWIARGRSTECAQPRQELTLHQLPLQPAQDEAIPLLLAPYPSTSPIRAEVLAARRVARREQEVGMPPQRTCHQR